MKKKISKTSVFHEEEGNQKEKNKKQKKERKQNEIEPFCFRLKTK